jgi:hypothetical protein
MKRGKHMNDTYIVTTYVVIDDVLKGWEYEDDCRASGYAAEILTVAVVAAKYFQNHHERALGAVGVHHELKHLALQPTLAQVAGLVVRHCELFDRTLDTWRGLHH